MKTDDDVKMISAEAPILFAKACELFILDLTSRSWRHAEENKRRTLQRNDIASAIGKADEFDCLIDIVPRDEVKSTRLRSDNNVISQANLHYIMLQQHLAQQQQMQAAVAASKISQQTGVSESNLAVNPAAPSMRLSQRDPRQFPVANSMAHLYLQQQMQQQLQAQQQHKEAEQTVSETQQHRMILLQHQQFLAQQRLVHAHLIQQQAMLAQQRGGASASLASSNPRTARTSDAPTTTIDV